MSTQRSPLAAIIFHPSSDFPIRHVVPMQRYICAPARLAGEYSFQAHLSYDRTIERYFFRDILPPTRRTAYTQGPRPRPRDIIYLLVTYAHKYARVGVLGRRLSDDMRLLQNCFFLPGRYYVRGQHARTHARRALPARRRPTSEPAPNARGRRTPHATPRTPRIPAAK